MELQLNTMAATMTALQARMAELSRLQEMRIREAEVVAIPAAAENAGEPRTSPVKPEIVVALTAAATAFLGKKASVRSAQSQPESQANAGAWAQQGRVIVQTSHNMRSGR
jgi:hypothetical protein